jgi:hypothetical protein
MKPLLEPLVEYLNLLKEFYEFLPPSEQLEFDRWQRLMILHNQVVNALKENLNQEKHKEVRE